MRLNVKNEFVTNISLVKIWINRKTNYVTKKIHSLIEHFAHCRISDQLIKSLYRYSLIEKLDSKIVYQSINMILDFLLHKRTLLQSVYPLTFYSTATFSVEFQWHGVQFSTQYSKLMDFCDITRITFFSSFKNRKIGFPSITKKY